MSNDRKWQKRCDNCDGDGKCPECAGTGDCQECNGIGQDKMGADCDECGGSGVCDFCADNLGKCNECDGKGWVERSKITPSPEFVSAYMRAKAQLETPPQHGSWYESIAYGLRDFCEIKLIELDDLAWALAMPRSGYTSKQDVIGFLEFVEQRVDLSSKEAKE